MFEYEVTDIPTDKHGAYNKSPEGKARRREYRKRSGKWHTSKRYKARPFVAIDGEAITTDSGEHVYNYLSLSTGESIRDDAGLSTLAVFNFLFQYLPTTKDGTAIIYGGSYDFNHWIKDLPREKLAALYESGYRDAPVEFGLYKVRWQGRSFTIRNIWGRTITIYDVVSFFQCTFLEAIESYLDLDPFRLSIIRDGKANRKAFRLEDMPVVIEYNKLELQLLVELMTELRERLDRVNLRPPKWTSPGAIAGALFRRYEIKSHMDRNIPQDVAEAARYAYAAGRFELCKYGSVSNRPSYEYDLNAAYPHAMLELPSLAGGTWEHRDGDPGQHDFTLYRVRTAARNTYTPSPVFVRGKHGSISFPVYAENWIWSPEMKMLRYWAERMNGEFEVLEAHVFTPATIIKPFAFMADLHKQRLELQQANDGAEVGVKLAQSSAYGKLCQQVGYQPATKRYPEQIPAYHQLEWAGYITSHTRAAVYMAALENPAAVISFETDAIFTDQPLENLEIGEELGQWKVTRFESLTYVQSGTYFGTTDKGEEIEKVRGFDPGTITRQAVEETLQFNQEHRTVTATSTRFVGLGVALQHKRLAGWRMWLTETRILRAYPVGKRIHGVCGCGVHGVPLMLNYWHQTLCPVFQAETHQYPVEWINPDEQMAKYRELRNVSRTELE